MSLGTSVKRQLVIHRIQVLMSGAEVFLEVAE
jgi:hypothetical protein